MQIGVARQHQLLQFQRPQLQIRGYPAHKKCEDILMEYNLRRLGERGFEQLVQALAVAEFGADVQVFGPGPDGGREAVFARLDYQDSVSGKPWSGYGVAQAKFVDVSESDPGLGYSRFKTAFRTELRTWGAKHSKRTRKPEFLLFATNASLSGVGRNGGIDKFDFDIRVELDKIGLALKAWDVWHYSRICSLLDKHQTVRNAYLGAIMPGDLLAAMYLEYNAKVAADSVAMLAALMSELSEQETMRVGEIGSSEQRSLPLSSIFLDVPAHRHSDDEEVLMACDALIQEFDAITRQSDPGARTSRVVLVGGPGQGKTTIGRFIAQAYRRTLIDASPETMISTSARTTAEAVGSAIDRNSLRTPVNRRWPIRIVLSEYAGAIKLHSDDMSLSRYIVDDFNKYSEVKISSTSLSGWLRTWPLLLVLDGMDEVPLDLRTDVVRQIDRFIDSASASNADLAVLITTRPQAQGTDFSADKYDHWQLDLLPEHLAVQYAKHLAELRFDVRGRALTELQNNIDSAVKNSNTRRLMTTPLQVAIMTLLLERRTRLPESRFGLFEEYFLTIYAREEAKPNFAGLIFQKYRPLIEGILERAAFVLHLRAESAQENGARLTDGELRILISTTLSEAGVSEGNESLAKGLLLAVTDRLVLLVSIQEGAWEFEIRSLQEFMVARSWTSGDIRPEDTATILDLTASSTFWRNTWLFAAGRAFTDKRSLRETTIAAVTALNVRDRFSNKIKPAASLAMDLLEDHSMESFPRYQRQLVPFAVEVCFVIGGPKATDLAHLLVGLQQDRDIYPITRDALESLSSQIGEWSASRHLFNVLQHSKGSLQGVGEKLFKGGNQDVSITEDSASSGSIRDVTSGLDRSTLNSSQLRAFSLLESIVEREMAWESDGALMIATSELEFLADELEKPSLRDDFAELIDGIDPVASRNGEVVRWLLHAAESRRAVSPSVAKVVSGYLIIKP